MFELWTEAVRSIEPMVKPAHRDLWLRPIECVGIDDGRIRLRAPNRYHKEWFEDNFLPSILKDLEARAQRPFTVDFEVVEEDAVAAAHVAGDRSSERSERGERNDRMTSSGSYPAAAPPPDLVSRYTFDKFVVGPTNQFAHAAARMVADAPASRWNPLFIYGGVGLGKTHLLQAIGHEIHRQHPEWAITFVTCEKFVTDFIGSIRRSSGTSMEDFRARYRTAPDVLLVDDIQFLSNKDSSQDEFFHTYNALHYAHKQIVLTSDKLPAELPGVEDRLRSRFTWGLIAEVETPDLETRVAILKRKAEAEKVSLPDEVALYLAAHIKTNVRELEGALLRLAARASFHGQEISIELARDALAKLIANAPSGLTIEAIQREVAGYFDVKLHDLKGPKRHRAIAHPRMIAMYLARKLTNMSYPEIGGRFGGKDHSTVISAVRKIERLCGEDPTVRSVVGTLESRLRQP
ncbi:MAG TPA: chromosomal replication initiator protein DnaA [Polyangia bacterium]|jgi:chromosomal replication initiator protein|nr:chromosomal replication initiator protein DnaA [Polyangia bacterium]